MSLDTRKLALLFPISLILYELPLYLSNTLLLPALPLLKQSFQVSSATAQSCIALWFLGASTLQVVFGPLSDHYGRKTVLLLGGLLFLAATLICSITTSMTLFLVARFFQGCVASTILISGYAVIHELLDTKQAVKTISWMGSITIMAPALGPLCGSLLLHVIHWRGLFIILMAMASISLLMLYAYMPQDKRTTEKFEFKKILQNYRTVCRNGYFLVLYPNLLCFIRRAYGLEYF